MSEKSVTVKFCEVCQTKFFDRTKSHNAKYCSLKCRNKKYENTQHRKMYLHRYYRRVRLPTYNLMKKCVIGTITDKDLKPKLINGQLRIPQAVYVSNTKK